MELLPGMDAAGLRQLLGRQQRAYFQRAFEPLGVELAPQLLLLLNQRLQLRGRDAARTKELAGQLLVDLRSCSINGFVCSQLAVWIWCTFAF